MTGIKSLEVLVDTPGLKGISIPMGNYVAMIFPPPPPPGSIAQLLNNASFRIEIKAMKWTTRFRNVKPVVSNRYAKVGVVKVFEKVCVGCFLGAKEQGKLIRSGQL